MGAMYVGANAADAVRAANEYSADCGCGVSVYDIATGALTEISEYV